MSRLPTLPERLLRLALGDNRAAASIIGDLREEYGVRPPGARRTLAYWTACLLVAARYAPSTVGDALWLDLRHAMRALRRSPTFTVTSVVALALGIGTASTLLTIGYGALVRPLPFPEPDQLIRWGQTPIGGSGGINSTATANFIDLATSAAPTSAAPTIELAAHALRLATVVGPDVTERVTAALVTANFFHVLSVRPALGRTFVRDDDLPGSQATVMLSHDFWQSAFGGGAGVVGQTIRLNTLPYVVVGVLPPGVTWPGNPRVWMTFRWEAEERQVRNSRQIEPIGRLSPGVTMAAATAQLQVRFGELASTYPEENGKSTVAVMLLSDWMLGRSGTHGNLLPLLSAVAVTLLLVAYLNVATLAIGRAEARRHETVLRAALGATSWRQWSRRLTEGTCIAGAGALGGALLAFWAIPLVIARYGTSIPRAATISPDISTALVILVALALGAALIALSGSHGSIGTPGQLNRRTSTGSLRLRRRLVAVQIALATGLVYGAMLLAGTLASLARVDLGVPLDNALTFTLGANAGRYTTPDQVHHFLSEVEGRLRQLPGVVAIGATTRQPFFGGTNGGVLAADDPSKVETLAEWRVVTPEFFAALGLRVIQGTDFIDRPRTGARVVVISELLASSLFPDRSAIGRAVRLDGDASYEVVGVVSDLRDFGPTRPSHPTVYLRHGSEPGFAAATNMNVVLRARQDPLPLLPAIRERLRDIDADAAIQNVQSLEALAVTSRGASRTTAATVVVTLAGLALMLGMIGVFGVVAVGVEQRTREIGVRLAMGDTPPGIMRRILADGARMSLAGLALGTAGAWVIHRMIDTFLVQAASPSRPVSAALAIAVLLIATLLACVVPARRAARLSPVDALRSD